MRLINININEFHEEIIEKLKTVYGMNTSEIIRIALVELYKQNKIMYNQEQEKYDIDTLENVFE